MSKEQLAFRYDGKRYQYKGLRENQEKDFFQMFLKFYKGDGPSPGEVEACFKDNFPDSRKGADELWQLCKAEQQRVEEKRARKERERRDAEAEEEEAATPRAKKKKDKKKDSDESEKKKKKKKKDSEDSDDKEKKKKKKKKEEEESEDGEKKKKKKDKKKKEEDSDEASSPREKKKKKKKEASSDEEDKRKKKKKEKEEKEARYKDPEDVPADRRASQASATDIKRVIEEVLREDTSTSEGSIGRSPVLAALSVVPTTRKFKLQWDGVDTLKRITLKEQPHGSFDELVKIVEAKCDGQSCLFFTDREGDRIEVDDDESLHNYFEELDEVAASGGKQLLLHCAMAHAPVTDADTVFARDPPPPTSPPPPPAAAAAAADPSVKPVAEPAAEAKPEDVLGGHDPDPVYGVMLDASGTRLVSVGRDKIGKLWDLKSHAVLGVLKGHSGMVLACDWTRNGKYVATSGDDKTVRVWDAEGRNMGKQRFSMKGHSDKVYCVAFSPDSRHLISGSNDKTVKVWGLQTGKKVATLKGHTASVFGCCYHPDSKTVASASDDMTVRVWDTTEKKDAYRQKGSITSHSDCLWSVCYSPNGKLLLSAGKDRALHMANAPDLTTKWKLQAAHTDSIHKALFIRGGKQVVSCSRDKCIKVWDAETGAPCGHIVNAHTGYIYCISVCKDRCLSSSHEGKLKLWALPGGESEGAT